ncbi:RNA-binding protein NOB1, putative [Plasmodium vivax]|uniref:RNA-binding protein NOB1, putative n=1 Tax=Plasmodium vivax TaxID=5855 RepID=A0A564ZR31_PLAVI|nr:RNA-binding protein NOB1, putative [Plasmodium vivax]
MSKHKYVLDANSVIKCKDLLFTNYDCYVTEGVIKEIKDENSRRRLNNMMPLLTVARAEERDVNFVKYFAKMTGDFDSLSEVDIDVIALTYMLHRMHGDVSKLNAAPMETIYKYDQVEFDYVGRGGAAVEEDEAAVGEDEAAVGEDEAANGEEEAANGEEEAASGEADETTASSAQPEKADSGMDDLKREDGESAGGGGMLDGGESPHESDAEEGGSPHEGDSDVESDSDGSAHEDGSLDARRRIRGCETIKEEVVQVAEAAEQEEEEEGAQWISINNYYTQNADVNMKEKFTPKVACVTTDYAMQNVLYQIGLNVITMDGYKINSIKLWGHICTSCYTFIKKSSLLFCSKCGNNNLRKVNVVVDNKLKKLVVKIPQFRVNTKNTIYSIPKKKNSSKKKFQDKLQIFREDELLIGGRKQFLTHQKKLYESQKSKKDPFSGDNLYDDCVNDWTYRTTLKNGKVAILTNPKIVVGGRKKRAHRRKKK